MDDLGTLEYQAAMDRVVLTAQHLSDEPLDKMLATIKRAHVVGPIQYPGDYRHALFSGSIHAQHRMLTAAREFAATLADVREACQ